MQTPDLSKLSREELVQLHKGVTKAIENYDTRKKQEAIAAAEAAAREHGFKLGDLTGSTKGNGKVNPPKYRHPENPSLTWTGRGRKPGWIKEAIEAGQSLDDFLIKA